MAGIRRLALSALILSLGWLTAGIAAAESKSGGSVLDQVPAQAPVLIHVRGIERTKDRLVTLIKNAVPDFGPLVAAQIDEALKKAMDDRELKGVPKDGAVVVAITELPDAGQDVPNHAVIIQVTDYKEFRDGLLKEEERKTLKKDPAGFEVAKHGEKDIYFLSQDGYAIMSSRKGVIEQLAKKHDSLASKLDDATKRQILEADVSLYVNMAAVNKKYGDQIQGIRQLIPMAMASMNQKLDASAMDAIKVFYEGVFQLVEDGQAFLLSLDFRPEGMAFHSQAKVGAETKSNAFLKESTPGNLDTLAQAPKDQMGYVGIRFGPVGAKAFLQMMGGPGGENVKGAARDAMTELAGAEAQNLTMDFNLPREGVQLFHFKEPEKAADAFLKLYRSLDAGAMFQNAYLKEKPRVQEGAESEHGFKLSSVSMVWDFDKMAESVPGAKGLGDAMKKLMGEGMNVWFGTDGKEVVQVSAKDWDSARQHLDNFLDGKNPVGDKQAFKDSRQHLPGETTVLALVDGPYYVEKMAGFVGPMLKAQGLPFDIPPLKATRGKSFFGMAVTLQPERGSYDLWIPVSAVIEIRKMIPQLGGGDVGRR